MPLTLLTRKPIGRWCALVFGCGVFLTLFSSGVGAAAPSTSSHWSFQPIISPALPKLSSNVRARNPIDQFILARLEAAQMTPAPEADRITLIRRLSFDVRGLPPTPSEVREFLSDKSSTAYEKLVDRFLDSPQYGERWAQHWLDVVRYGESEGFEYDREIPDAWRFRDYVVNSLNADKPFDQFVREQIAGDEMRPEKPELFTAAIFHRLGPVRRNAGNADVASSRNEVLTERTDIIGAAVMGLTMGCARCHDHKFDPISQKDYYQLQAYMAATQEHDIVQASEAEKANWERLTKDTTTQIAQLRKESKTAEGERRMVLEEKINELERTLPPHLPTIPSIQDGERTDIHILKRGDAEKKGEQVRPHPPGILAGDEPELPADAPGPRLKLAEWLTRCDNPLTARVIANRLWQYHFGQGLVKTPNDFGVNGDRPSHPELLDWLASDLVEGGWRLKRMHRQILTSSTYRQASVPRSEFAAKDPENRLLSHFNRRRLEAGEIRDAMLAVSGQLNPQRGGSSVIVPTDSELVKLLYKPTQWTVTKSTTEHNRRTLYLMAKRNLRLPFLEVFDEPALQTSCPRREASTHAPQALELLNGKTANHLANHFSERLLAASSDPEKQIEMAFQLATSRLPTPEEKKLAIEFLRSEPLKEFALAMFNLNSFLYVP